MRSPLIARWLICTALALLANCASEPAGNDLDPPVGPTASAGPDTTVVVGEQVNLDATASMAGTGMIRAYRWDVLARTPGSTARPTNATASITTMTLDVPGRYEVLLTVEDARGFKVRDQVTLTAVPPTVVVDAGPDQDVAWRTEAFVTGIVSIGGVPTLDNVRWHILAAPIGGTAHLEGDLPTVHFYADTAGTYRLELSVETPYGIFTDTVEIGATAPVQQLGVLADDIEYTKQRDEIVALREAPATLIRHGPTTGTTIRLDLPPGDSATDVAIDPSGQRAAIARGGTLVIVDLDTLKIDQTIGLPTSEPAGVAFGRDQRVYLIPLETPGPIQTVELATGTVTQSVETVPAGAPFALTSDGGTLVVAHESMWGRFTTTSPATLVRYVPFVEGTIASSRLWPSELEGLLYDETGFMYQLSETPALDFNIIGALWFLEEIMFGIADSVDASLIAGIGAFGDGYELTLLEAEYPYYRLTNIPVPSGVTPQATAIRSDGQAVYIVANSEAESVVFPVGPSGFEGW